MFANTLIYCLFAVSLIAAPAWKDEAFLGQFVAVSTVGGTSPCSLTNGLAAYWSLNGVLSDASGQGNTLTTHSVAFAPGYLFQGMDSTSGGYATINDNSTLGIGGTNSFSISLWVNMQTASALKCYLHKGTAFAAANSTYIIYNTGTVWRFGVGDQTHSATVDSTVTPAAFTWYNLIAVYDANAKTINLWCNGTSNTPVAYGYGTPRNASAFSIGANSQGSYVPNAYVDEVVIWTNRALNPVEIGMIYTNSTQGHTPLNYCDGLNHRSTIIFNGDAYFAATGSSTNIPSWFAGQIVTVGTSSGTYNSLGYGLLGTSSWVSNHNATVVNYSAGTPPATYAVEQVDDWTNTVNTAHVLAWSGPGTNLYLVAENGINDIYIMTGSPLYGYWTAETIGYQMTNYCRMLKTNGVKVVMTDVMPFWGLENDPGDGTLSNSELVRQRVNQILSDGSSYYFSYFPTASFISTNGTPYCWTVPANVCEFNDRGNTNYVMHLNALLNSIAQ